jgi:lipopolysaccharide transport system ATP-binding protein
MAAIQAYALSKRYKLRTNYASYSRLTEGLQDAARRLVGKNRLERDSYLWALNKIDFEIEAGCTVGLIGRNGAGKSTLLKVLSGVTAPTEGHALIRGRVGSLLEVGAGFHPELSGRENIFLNGAILGMARAEINRAFDDIVEFAEVGPFLETPVKRFSSGMYVRLAFAVAAHLRTEILFLDEVLSVGDQAFQKRSFAKIADIHNQGRTLIFVSHNLSAVNQLCRKSIWLDKGTIKSFDGTRVVIDEYVKHSEDQRANSWNPSDDGRSASLVRANLLGGGNYEVGTSPLYEIDVQVTSPLENLQVACSVLDSTGRVILALHSGRSVPSNWGRGIHRLTVEIPCSDLAPGRYRTVLDLGKPGIEHLDQREGSAFILVDINGQTPDLPLFRDDALLRRKTSWQRTLLRE